MSSLKQTIGNKARPSKPGLHTGDVVWKGRQTSRELTTIQVIDAIRDLQSKAVTAQGREGFLEQVTSNGTMSTAYL